MTLCNVNGLLIIYASLFDLGIHARTYDTKRNESGVVGQHAKLPCHTDMDYDVDWKRELPNSAVPEYIYTNGKIYQSYMRRFMVDRAVTGDYNLLINPVHLEDGGLYICTEDGGYGRKHAIWFSVSTANDNQPMTTDINQLMSASASSSTSNVTVIVLIVLPVVLLAVVIIAIVIVFLYRKEKICNSRPIRSEEVAVPRQQDIPPKKSSTPNRECKKVEHSNPKSDTSWITADTTDATTCSSKPRSPLLEESKLQESEAQVDDDELNSMLLCTSIDIPPKKSSTPNSKCEKVEHSNPKSDTSWITAGLTNSSSKPSLPLLEENKIKESEAQVDNDELNSSSLYTSGDLRSVATTAPLSVLPRDSSSFMTKVESQDTKKSDSSSTHTDSAK